MLAYVLAKIEAGKDREVFNQIKRLMGVKRACATYGIYDLLIEAEFDTVERLDAFVFDTVRKITGVKETVTMISSEIII